MSRWKLLHGDCRDQLATIPDNSIDAIVTDPPYELGFMGKSWDASGIAYNPTVWTECLRVLKPGGHLLAFSGSRTYHRMAVAIEDAGFQIRDQIMWVYGSGFPKSLDISKAIDKAAGAEREVIGFKNAGIGTGKSYGKIVGERQEVTSTEVPVTAPATPEAEVWEGWGTALKPAHEPIVLARKPLVGTVAENVLRFGVGGLNIDGCRVETTDFENMTSETFSGTKKGFGTWNAEDKGMFDAGRRGGWIDGVPSGRWPANLIHDGSDEVLELFPETAGGARPAKANKPTGQHYEGGWGTIAEGERINFPAGSAARFFYCAKASKKDRNEGLDHLTPQRESDRTADNLPGGDNPRNRTNTPRLNHHPTVKPTELMRYLCRLITPPNGVILDPFTGSGSTGKAAILEHFQFIGIEQDPDYITIAQARIQHAEQETQP